MSRQTFDLLKRHAAANDRSELPSAVAGKASENLVGTLPARLIIGRNSGPANEAPTADAFTRDASMSDQRWSTNAERRLDRAEAAFGYSNSHRGL
jgi:hypothetical protein